jgi:hypothetical protein
MWASGRSKVATDPVGDPLVAALIRSTAGLLSAMHDNSTEPLASMPIDEFAAHLAELLRHILFGPNQ